MSDKPSHPPIPEMEGYHVDVGWNGDFMYFFIFHDAVGSVTLDSRCQRHRVFIAARFEVAWLEKDDYWHDEHLDTTDDNAEKKIMEKRNECMRNAAAWRAWGKGEWKP